MQQDPEKYFDDRIRKKLQEDEELSVPPFEVVSKQVKGSGNNWLRGFFMSDLMLFLFSGMLALNLPSGQNANALSDQSFISNQSSVAENRQSVVDHKKRFTGADNYSGSVHSSETANNKTGVIIPAATGTAAHEQPVVNQKKLTSVSDSDANVKSAAKNLSATSDLTRSLKETDSNVLNDISGTSADENLRFAYVASEPATEGNESPGNLVMMSPLPAELNYTENYTVQTRETGRTNQHYYKPFTIDLLIISEKTLGYNTITPDVHQLKLNMKPDGSGFGGGLLFNYRIVNHMGIKSGIETIRRDYTLKYNYTQIIQLDPPESGTVTEILTTSRSVSETEMRIPFMLTYTMRSNKWIFEGAAGINIKFKNLTVRNTANNEIPAEVLSAVEVGNSHLVTSGWTGAVLAGYQISNSAVIILNPYFQAETFGKSSRQYYTGRAVSGAGVKAGVRFHFNRQ